MPYYRNKHILFIHIPKTGGTMFESLMMNIDKQELFSLYSNKLLPPPFNKYSLQHQFYSTIFKYNKLCNINFDNKLKVISIVRNPYDRIISDLFWFTKLGMYNFINKESTPENVYKSIKTFINLHPEKVDNHNTPQYKYLVDKNNNLYENIKIFKLEKLYDSNADINNFLNTNLVIENQPSKNYNKYLNKKSILLINTFYSKDFELLNYDMNFYGN